MKGTKQSSQCGPMQVALGHGGYAHVRTGLGRGRCDGGCLGGDDLHLAGRRHTVSDMMPLFS